MKKEFFKVVAIVLTIMLIIPTTVNARGGCCSHHGGVTGSCSNGRQVCADGNLKQFVQAKQNRLQVINLKK